MEKHLTMQSILIALELNILQKKIQKFIEKKDITNIYKIQAYDSIMCGYFCIGFIDFILKVKSLLDHTNLFSPNNTKIFSLTKSLR